MAESGGKGAFAPWEQLDDEALDPPVRAWVHALNATGWVRTVFSCAGHPEEPDSPKRGRRQAHVDVVTRDLARWHEYVRACRQRLRDEQALVVREGTLGPVPDWLARHLHGGASPDAMTGAPASWWQRVRRAGDGAGSWHYRRLVLEPRPYDGPELAVRAALNGALAVATAALAEYTERHGPTATR